MISDQSGRPLAPVAQRLVSGDGSYTAYQGANLQPTVQNHWDGVGDCIRFSDRQGFAKPLVHLIDRGGDSIGPIRLWEAAGSHWLVRVKAYPKVNYAGKPWPVKPWRKSQRSLKPGKPVIMARPIGSGWWKPR